MSTATKTVKSPTAKATPTSKPSKTTPTKSPQPADSTTSKAVTPATPKKADAKKADSKAKTAPKKAATTAQGVQPSFTPYESGKNEEYMSDEQLAHFRAILLAWKDELVEEAESTKTYIQDESTAMPDINDRATQEEEFALALRTRDRERKLIRKIDKSLAEMESGDYGFCQTCGVEIGIRRLEARPTATQCIDCKTLSEMKEKQAWGHI